MKQDRPDTDIDIQRKLLRQLKLLNLWISIFGTIVLVTLAVVLFMVFQLVGFVRDTNQRVDEVRQNLDVQSQACDSEGGFGDFLRQRTGFCE